MKFEQKFKIGIREIGLENKLTNYGFLAFLVDIATNHSDSVGYGVKDIETKKVSWLILDWELEVLRRPVYGEELEVYTFAEDVDKQTFHVYRNFEVYDKEKNLIATASSKWILFDINKGKIARLDKDYVALYNPENNIKIAESRLEKVQEPTVYHSVYNYQVKRSDIDVNKHMNNLNYLKLAYEALPEDIYFGTESNNLRIMYKHQIRLGAKVKCFYSNEDGRHIVTIKNEDESVLHSIVELW